MLKRSRLGELCYDEAGKQSHVPRGCGGSRGGDGSEVQNQPESCRNWVWLKVDQGFFPTDTLFFVDIKRGGERAGPQSYAEATRRHKLSA